jgi:iron complex outermembrane receptor protein
MDKGRQLMGYRGVRSGLAVSVAICAVAIASPAMAQSKTFNVPAQSAITGIPELARQGDVQIMVSESAARGKVIKAVRGKMTVQQALQRALAGTGLRASSVDGRTFTLVPAVTADATAAVTEGEEGDRDQDIVVTGSRIKGAIPASPVQVLDSKYIEESGKSTTAEVLRTVTANFSGGQNETVVGTAGSSLNDGNVSRSSGANLRGLGSDSTLVLVNGHRLASTGFQASVDVSAIPISAIDRIEILTDGASSVYGSDAVAGVINLVIKPSFHGLEVRGERGRTADGGAGFDRFDATAGINWSSGNIVVGASHFEQDKLFASQRPYSSRALQPLTLIPGVNRDSIFANGRQSITPELRLLVTGLYTDRRSSADQAVGNTISSSGITLKQAFGTASLEWDVGGDWSVTAVGSIGDDRNKGTILLTNIVTGVRSPNLQDYHNTLRAGAVEASGSLFSIPAGNVKASIGSEYRREEFVSVSTSSTGARSQIEGNRSVASLYGELYVPLVSPSQEVSFVNSASITAGVRYEHYNSFGGSVNPKVGITYNPVPSLKLSGTWGRSFSAPALITTSQGTTVLIQNVPNPNVPSGSTVLLRNAGGNPDLTSATAVSRTLSAAWSPPKLPGAKLSVSYYAISYSGRTLIPVSGLANLFTNPAFAPVINLNPSADEINSILAAASTVTNSTGRPLTTSLIQAVLDNRYANLGSYKSSGIDLLASVPLEFGNVKVQISAQATHIFNLSYKITSTSPVAELEDHVFFPAKDRVRLGAVSNVGGFSASVFANYTGSYTDTVTQPQAPVSSYLTIDGRLSYRLGENSGVLRGLAVWVAGSNIFNRRPPSIRPTTNISTTPIGFDATNASAVGRLITFGASMAF